MSPRVSLTKSLNLDPTLVSRTWADTVVLELRTAGQNGTPLVLKRYR